MRLVGTNPPSRRTWLWPDLKHHVCAHRFLVLALEYNAADLEVWGVRVQTLQETDAHSRELGQL